MLRIRFHFFSIRIRGFGFEISKQKNDVILFQFFHFTPKTKGPSFLFLIQYRNRSSCIGVVEERLTNTAFTPNSEFRKVYNTNTYPFYFHFRSAEFRNDKSFLLRNSACNSDKSLRLWNSVSYRNRNSEWFTNTYSIFRVRNSENGIPQT